MTSVHPPVSGSVTPPYIGGELKPRIESKARYQIVVEAPAGDEGIRKLRALLKWAWRALGLKCVSVEPVGGSGLSEATRGRCVDVREVDHAE